jgi:hypothetical protein
MTKIATNAAGKARAPVHLVDTENLGTGLHSPVAVRTS